MANVCVITGGGSGMGLAAAKFMPKDKIIVISGRTLSKLEVAVKELEALGYTAYAKACDTSKRERKKDNIKASIIDKIAAGLLDITDNLEITNSEREIVCVVEGRKFKITLSAPRS
jgi:short-subunit dehydrogenase